MEVVIKTTFYRQLKTSASAPRTIEFTQLTSVSTNTARHAPKIMSISFPMNAVNTVMIAAYPGLRMITSALTSKTSPAAVFRSRERHRASRTVTFSASITIWVIATAVAIVYGVGPLMIQKEIIHLKLSAVATRITSPWIMARGV